MTVTRAVEYTKGAELPAKGLTVYDAAGGVVDLSSGAWVFTFKIGYPGETAKQTTGITFTGQATAPNLICDPVAGAFDTLPIGQYTLQVNGRNGTEDRMWKFPFILGAAVL